MNLTKLKGSIVNAAKWSSITEIAVRIVSPITNMILARILVPDAFGVVATVSMIISFASMFSDAGFQKYLVQHEFKNEELKIKSTTVAFWTNLVSSLFFWGLIVMFCEPIATAVGNPGLGIVIAISCVQLPLTAFSSIQMALYKRDFDFKTLFQVRMITICLPFIITIPLALLGFSYWALIIGTICGHLSNAVILTYKSKWKPSLFFDMTILKDMLSFSIWSFFEAVSIWLSSWVDTLIIGSALSLYYLGLYKTSLNMVNALNEIVTASITTILFSSLSRLQKDSIAFENMFFRFQEIAAYLLFPLGLGLFIYSDVATQVMLGEQWADASFVIGVWGLTSAVKIVFSDFNSECYRAKGMPKLSLFLQMIHLAFLIPTCIFALKFGFHTLVYSRALIRFQLVITSLLTMQFVLHIPIKVMIKRVIPPAIFSIIMGATALCLRQIYDNLIWNLLSILACILLYGLLVLVYTKKDMGWLFEIIRKRQLKINAK